MAVSTLLHGFSFFLFNLIDYLFIYLFDDVYALLVVSLAPTGAPGT